MTRRRLPVAARLLAAAIALSAAEAHAADPAGTKTFDTWTATCNNLAECVAVGAQDGDLLTLLVARGPGPEAEASVKLHAVRTDEDKTPVAGAALTVVDGDKQTRLDTPEPRQWKDDDRMVGIEWPAGAGRRGFIEAVRNATSLKYKIGSVDGSLSLKGLSAALRWIDERQGRAGTAGALVAEGNATAAQVPPPRPVPEVTPAPAGSAEELTNPPVGAALKNAMPKGDACDAELLRTSDGGEAPATWKLAPDRLLVAMPCTRGAYNFGSALFFTDAAGNSPRPVQLHFPPGPRDTEANNILVNAEFDPAKMELTEFDKGRGLGDCGSLTTWVWTGRAFELLNAAVQSTCAGLSSDDWPNLYRAVKSPK